MLELLKFDIGAQNRTSGIFRDIKTELGGIKGALVGVNDYANRFGRNLRNIGAGMSAGITAPLTLIGKQSVQLYDQQVRAEKAVEQAVLSTGGAAGKTASDLKGLASALQEVTTFGDEDILQNVTAPMLTFTKVQGEVFDRAQANVLDMATLLKMDLKSASILVGKALNDPVKGLSALSRSGVQFSESQKAVITSLMETGDVAGAQTLILQELETQFKGQAAAAASAPLGQWRQLSNAIGDAKEELGKEIVPFLKPLVTSVKEAVQWFADLSPEVKKTAVQIGGIAAVAGPVLTFFGMAAMGVGTLTTALTTMGTALLANPVIAAIAAIAGGAYLIYRNWDGITGWFAAKWEAIKSGAAAGWEKIKQKVNEYAPQWLKDSWGNLGTWFTTQWRAVQGSVSLVWEEIKSSFQGDYSPSNIIYTAWTGLSTWFDTKLREVAQTFQFNWTMIKLQAEFWVDDFLGIGRRIVDALKQGVADKWNDLVTWFTSKMGALTSIGDKTLQDALGGGSSGAALGTSLGDASAEGLSKSIEGYLGSTKERGAALGGALTKGARDELGIRSPSREFWNIGNWIVQGLGLGVKENKDFALKEVDSLMGEIKEKSQQTMGFMSTLRSGVQGAFKSILTGAQDFRTAFSGLLSNLGNSLIDSALGGIFNLIWPMAKGGVMSGGRVAAFANGGVVSSPTFFPMRGGTTGLMGEAGPEAIMPLTRMGDGKLGVRAGGGGGTGQVVNVNYAPQIDARGADAAAVARIEASQRAFAANLDKMVQDILRTGRNRRHNLSWSTA